MKTKALISFAVTAKLICVFVFAYTESRFSHDTAHVKVRLKCIPAQEPVVMSDTPEKNTQKSKKGTAEPTPYFGLLADFRYYLTELKAPLTQVRMLLYSG